MRRKKLLLLWVAVLFAATLCSSGADARGRLFVRDMKDYVDFSASTGVTYVADMSPEYAGIVNRDDMLGDLEDAFLAADSGELDGFVDPSYRRVEVHGSPRFVLVVEDGRNFSTFFTDNMLGALRLYDRYRDEFIGYQHYASSIGVSDIRMTVDVEDGGRFDLDNFVDGKVRVAVAIGAGITDDEDFTDQWGRGGCQTGGAFPLLLTTGVLLFFRRR